MTKKNTLYAFLFLGMTLISFQALTNSGGAPGGSTGSPQSNGNTCARSSCHVNGPSVSTQSIDISHDIPASGFLPNTDYTFTITATSGAAVSNRIGFQLSVESDEGFAGTLSTDQDPTLLKVGPFIGHAFSGITASGGEKSWEFIWNSGEAPDESTVYVACNFTNNNGTTTGDVIVTETLVLSRDESVSIVEKKMAEFTISPNPARDVVNIEGLSSEVSAIEILSLDGKLIQSFNVHLEGASDGTWKCDVSDLPSGNYIMMPQGALYSPERLIVH